jgi:uncharacterized membrane protein
MKTKLTAGNWLAYVIMAVPIAYLAIIYPSLPTTIPTHFGLHGPDKWGSKTEAWLPVLIMTGSSLFAYLLFKNVGLIDPKKNTSQPGSMIDRIGMVTVVFLSALQLLIIYAMQGNEVVIEKITLPLTSLFFAFLGNAMMHVKPNYFVGIRVPWTLENEDNWRKTHRLAGKLWFATGLLLCLITFLLPFEYAIVVFMTGAITITIIPIGYSYSYFRKQQKNQP